MKTIVKSMVLAAAVLLGLVNNVVAQSKDATVILAANVTCENCKAKIEKNMGFQKGVNSVNADIDKDIVTINYKVGKNDAASLSAALEKLGYENTINSSTDTTKACCKKGKGNCCKKGAAEGKPCCKGDSTKCKKAEGKSCCKKEKKADYHKEGEHKQ